MTTTDRDAELLATYRTARDALDTGGIFYGRMDDREAAGLRAVAAAAWNEGRSAVITNSLRYVEAEEPLEGYIDQHVVAIFGSKITNPYETENASSNEKGG